MSNRAHSNDRPLREEIRRLGETLGRVIREQESLELFETEETIRGLAKDARSGNTQALQALDEKIQGLDLGQAASVARAFTLFFDLANLAEDRHRVRVLRARERNQYPQPRKESIGAAIRSLKEAGWSAGEVQQLLEAIIIEPVFTAHPTEAKRRTLRIKLARLREYLNDLDNEHLLQRERKRLQAQLHAELTSLWQTDMLRFQRPSVLNEVEYGISFLRKLWDVVPKLLQDLSDALQEEYPEAPIRFPRLLEFGSWIGGDRDGNPHVTPEITRETFALHHRTAIQLHLTSVRKLLVTVSSSENQVAVDPQLKQSVRDALDRWPACESRVDDLSPYEPYRHWLTIIEWRLQQTLKVLPGTGPPKGSYARARELQEDVELMIRSLEENKGRVLVIGALREWRWQISVFGFRMARLDIRQESGVHRNVIDEILQTVGFETPFIEMSPAERERARSAVSPDQLREQQTYFSVETQRMLKVFEVITQGIDAYGPEILGGYVISMTHDPADILTILYLGQWTGLCRCGPEHDEPCPLEVVPLFETIDDLRRASRILNAALQDPVYAEHVRHRNSKQMIMIGYSDSSKDGGYLMANWSLYLAQQELCAVAKDHDVRLFFFHGRGGSLGRGGGPAARSILALPPASAGTGLRMTEQGEVLAERYDNPAVTYRHLEQVLWATLMVNSRFNSRPREAWKQTCATLAEASYTAYRQLVEHPEFIPYFHQASPLAEIEALPIGSRPSRRSGTASLEDLRAIPWAFSWTQNRHLLPAWYGLGQACVRSVEDGDIAWEQLQEMYEEWPFFHAIINNAMLGLAKADLSIARHYLRLAKDPEGAGQILSLIVDEYQRSREAVRRIVNVGELLENIPWLERSIEVRNPYVDPLNFIQVVWLQQMRSMDEDDSLRQETEELIRLTIYGIASGMRTTG